MKKIQNEEKRHEEIFDADCAENLADSFDWFDKLTTGKLWTGNAGKFRH
jgi:hypothetical protein